MIDGYVPIKSICILFKCVFVLSPALTLTSRTVNISLAKYSRWHLFISVAKHNEHPIPKVYHPYDEKTCPGYIDSQKVIFLFSVAGKKKANVCR